MTKKYNKWIKWYIKLENKKTKVEEKQIIFWYGAILLFIDFNSR
jgi:hypothetical protein